MRITFGTKYNQMDYYQNTMQNKLSETNTKIASGLKIKYGYEDSSIFNQNLKLEYDVHKLNQSIDISNDANTNTRHNDKAMSDISKSLDDFKVKLIQASNDIHSQTSRDALANDMQSIRNHILSIANTSIGGDYIFGGSRTKIKPFNDDGSYNGNNEKLESLVAPDIKSPYNITGRELFLSRDLDKTKIITTNIKQLNQSKLHPSIMDKLNKTKLSEEVYITKEDTLRDLIGDSDSDTSNDEEMFFYIRGRGPDGKAFKAKFSLDVAYSNKESATKVEDLLTKIGEAYGNTSQNQVVDVRLNNWGQIEIEEIKNGGGYIEFNMIASNKDVDSVNDLHQMDSRVINFQKNPYLSDFSLSKLVSTKDNYDRRYTSLPIELITKDNQYALKDTMLEDVFESGVRKIKISASAPNEDNGKISNRKIEDFEIDLEKNTIDDLLKTIEKNLGGNVKAEISNGKINIIDNNVMSLENDEKEPPFNGESGLMFSITTLDSDGNEIEGIRNGYKTNYDKSGFLNNGSSLKSNISQINPLDGEYATPSTRLSDVASKSLEGENYIMKLKDNNGVDISSRIEFTSKGAYLIIGEGEYTIPLYNPHDSPPEVSITNPDEVTYKQLFDAMSIALNYSNSNKEDLKNSQEPLNQSSKEAYERLLKAAKSNVEVGFSEDGKIEIKDKIRSITRMEFMIYNKNSDSFDEENLKEGEPSLIFNANVALEIDRPHINFFKQLDSMIDAVRKGIYRPDATGDNYNLDIRNIGIQNAIDTFDHLKDHVEKNIALNGSYGRFFENNIQRNEALKVQVESLKSDTIGTDVAETYNKFSQLTNNYNAILASTSRINQMSLVDFLK